MSKRSTAIDKLNELVVEYKKSPSDSEALYAIYPSPSEQDSQN